MSSVLADFAANEVGWTAVLDALQVAYQDFVRNAANATTHEEHLDYRGKMRGVEHTIVLIQKCRTQFRTS